MLSPACWAITTHVPAPTKLRLVPDTEQIPAVPENDTGRLEVAVAANNTSPPTEPESVCVQFIVWGQPFTPFGIEL